MKSLPNHSICRLRDTESEDIKDLRSIILSEVMVMFSSSFGIVVILNAKTRIIHEHLPRIIIANVFVNGIGSCSSSSEIHQVDQGTSISCQRDSFFPHLCVAAVFDEKNKEKNHISTAPREKAQKKVVDNVTTACGYELRVEIRKTRWKWRLTLSTCQQNNFHIVRLLTHSDFLSLSRRKPWCQLDQIARKPFHSDDQARQIACCSRQQS